jgi:hypothetical protein
LGFVTHGFDILAEGFGFGKHLQEPPGSRKFEQPDNPNNEEDKEGLIIQQAVGILVYKVAASRILPFFPFPELPTTDCSDTDIPVNTRVYLEKPQIIHPLTQKGEPSKLHKFRVWNESDTSVPSPWCRFP